MNSNKIRNLVTDLNVLQSRNTGAKYSYNKMSDIITIIHHYIDIDNKEIINHIIDSITDNIEMEFKKGIYQDSKKYFKLFFGKDVDISFDIDTQCKNKRDCQSNYNCYSMKDNIVVSLFFNSNKGKFEKSLCKKCLRKEFHKIYNIFFKKLLENIFAEDFLIFLMESPKNEISNLIWEYLHTNNFFILNQEELEKIINLERNKDWPFLKYCTIDETDLKIYFKESPYYEFSKRIDNIIPRIGLPQYEDFFKLFCDKVFDTKKCRKLFNSILSSIKEFEEERFVNTYDYVFDEKTTNVRNINFDLCL
jgi:hypothetical protein